MTADAATRVFPVWPGHYITNSSIEYLDFELIYLETFQLNRTQRLTEQVKANFVETGQMRQNEKSIHNNGLITLLCTKQVI